MNYTIYLKKYLKCNNEIADYIMLNHQNCDTDALNSLFHAVFRSKDYVFKIAYFDMGLLHFVAEHKGRKVRAFVNDFAVLSISDKFVTKAHSESFAEFMLRRSNISYVNDFMKYKITSAQNEL